MSHSGAVHRKIERILGVHPERYRSHSRPITPLRDTTPSDSEHHHNHLGQRSHSVDYMCESSSSPRPGGGE